MMTLRLVVAIALAASALSAPTWMKQLSMLTSQGDDAGTTTTNCHCDGCDTCYSTKLGPAPSSVPPFSVTAFANGRYSQTGSKTILVQDGKVEILGDREWTEENENLPWLNKPTGPFACPYSELCSKTQQDRNCSLWNDCCGPRRLQNESCVVLGKVKLSALSQFATDYSPVLTVEWIGASTDGLKEINSTEDTIGGEVLLNDGTAFKNIRTEIQHRVPNGTWAPNQWDYTGIKWRITHVEDVASPGLYSVIDPGCKHAERKHAIANGAIYNTSATCAQGCRYTKQLFDANNANGYDCKISLFDKDRNVAPMGSQCFWYDWTPTAVTSVDTSSMSDVQKIEHERFTCWQPSA